MATKKTPTEAEIFDELIGLREANKFLENQVAHYRRLYTEAHYRLEGTLLAISTMTNERPPKIMKAL